MIRRLSITVNLKSYLLYWHCYYYTDVVTLAPKTIVSTVPKKDLIIALPYLGNFPLHCGGCNATYYDKTKRHIKVRMC